MTKTQLEEVANLQLSEESDSDADILVSDTAPISAEAYSFYYHNESSDELKNLSSRCDRYDILILCDTDIPFEDDEVRSGDATRKEIQEHTKNILERENLDYTLVSGDVNHRLSLVQEKIEEKGKI